jgi:TetR/AcrR family transcriptional repressor of nem operon
MPRDASKTRKRILDAAQQNVLERGFAATSVDDIQTSAGISRGTFFYHFSTKDDLARALIERYAHQDALLIDGLMARAENLASDPLQQALIFLGLHEELFLEAGPEQVGCLFASYSYEAGLFDSETHERVRGSIEHWRELLGGKLRQAMARHGVRTPEAVDPDLLADMAYGTLQGAFILKRTFGSQGLMVDHIRQFRRFLELLFGVVGEEEGASMEQTPA